MLARIDRAIERFKARHRWLQLWDRIPDQTHLHHTMVVILFGVIGLALGSFKLGLLVGLGFYLVREVYNQFEILLTGQSVRFWDGILDVVVPFWVTYPWIVGWVPGWLALTLFVALMYGPLRRDER